jgi:hypothetical protein
VLLEPAKALAAVPRDPDAMPFRGQQLCQRLHDILVVIDDEQVGHRVLPGSVSPLPEGGLHSPRQRWGG